MTLATDARTMFEEIAAEECAALFAHYGVDLELVDAVSSEGRGFLICGVIGFSGRHVRGSVVLALTHEPLWRSHPLGTAGHARDWMGELTNQLLGRLKAKLLAKGIEIYLHLPAVLRGEHLAPMPRQTPNPVRFETEGGEVGVWVEVETGPDFRLDGVGEAAPCSGEPLLFEP